MTSSRHGITSDPAPRAVAVVVLNLGVHGSTPTGLVARERLGDVARIRGIRLGQIGTGTHSAEGEECTAESKHGARRAWPETFADWRAVLGTGAEMPGIDCNRFVACRGHRTPVQHRCGRAGATTRRRRVKVLVTRIKGGAVRRVSSNR